MELTAAASFASAWGTPTAAAAIILTAVVLGLTSAAAIQWPPRRERVLPNPLKTGLISRLPDGEELGSLVYQPDQFPGARDVETPYGSMRVYEFGPEDGHKVLLIHGISTSCVTLGRLAHGLVDRGCRVMLFDLFGRGFSDGVADLPHDARLYISQILLALASSPLPWTGSAPGLRVVGYSLGGGIAVHLANILPHLVSSLVLLAPAGLIRPETFGAVSRFIFSSGFVPERLVAVLTRRRLRQPIASSRRQRRAAAASPDAVGAAAAIAAEASDPPPGETASPLERRVLLYVQWMAEHHAGFVPAFMSCIRHAPLTGQHESWAKLAGRRAGSTVVMLAEADEIIDAEEYTREALPLVGGEDRVVWTVLPGGHDFVMTHAEDILRVLDGAWSVNA